MRTIQQKKSVSSGAGLRPLPLWLGLLTGLLAALAGAALSLPTHASGTSPPPALAPSLSAGPPSPDPRWLDLVRAQGAPGPRLQAAAPSLHVHLTDRTVAGRVPSPAPVSVRVSRGDTVYISTTVQPVPEGDGYLYVVALPPWGTGTWAYGYCGEPFLPGDVFWAVQGSAVLSLTLPSLSALADPDADRVSGTAPPSETVALYLYPRAAPDAVLTQTVAAGPEGTYQASWADLRPGDTGFVAWSAAPNRTAYLRFVAPLLQVQVNGAEVVGMAPPCTGVALDVADAAGNPLIEYQTYTGRDGRFQAWLWWAEKEEGLPKLLPGYRVRASAAGQVFFTTVLPVTARTDRESGQVLGTAPAGAPVRVEVAHGPIEWASESILQRPPWASVWVTATAQGRYTATVPLAPADYGAAFAVGPDGHETFARFAVPYLQAILGRERYGHEFRLWGQVDDSNVPLTLTLQGPTGLLKDVRSPRSAGNGFFYDLLQDTDPVLESGDVLTAETPHGLAAALTLPTLTARVDVLSDTVSGEAPPGARVTVRIWEMESPGASGLGDGGPAGPAGGGGPPTPPPFMVQVSQVVTAEADGTYVADFRGMADLTHRSWGEVSLTTPEGHTVVRPFRAYDCRPVLTSVFVGGNGLSGESSQGCPSATIRLRDPAGVLKAQAYADFAWQNWFSLYFYLYEVCPVPDWCGGKSHPILILPGDRIEVESGGAVYTTTVPTLTLEVDRETPALSGWGPPGETLQGEVRSDTSAIHHTFTATVDAQGRYTVPLTGIYTPTAGESITVRWQSGETRFHALDVLPRLEAALFGTYLYGSLHPLAPYEIPAPSSGSYTGYAGPDGGFSAYVDLLFPGRTVTVTMPQEEVTLTLPLLTARADRGTATVSGEAPPDAPLEVRLAAYPLYLSRQVTAPAAGTYTVSFPDAAPLPDGAWGTVRSSHPQGHRVFLQFGLRAWSVALGERCAGGYADMAGAPFTATLEAADGFTESVTETASLYNASFSVCFSRPLGSGDRLRLVQDGRETEFVVPRLTARHDWAAQVLEGEAPPGSLVEVTFPRGWRSSLGPPGAAGAGRYRLDTRDLGLRLGDSGAVAVTDAAGNTTRLGFRSQGLRVYLPLIVR